MDTLEREKDPGVQVCFRPAQGIPAGHKGVYEPPRDVLKSIPGIKLTEMDQD